MKTIHSNEIEILKKLLTTSLYWSKETRSRFVAYYNRMYFGIKHPLGKTHIKNRFFFSGRTAKGVAVGAASLCY